MLNAIVSVPCFDITTIIVVMIVVIVHTCVIISASMTAIKAHGRIDRRIGLRPQRAMHAHAATDECILTECGDDKRVIANALRGAPSIQMPERTRRDKQCELNNSRGAAA